jgi:hypothetical protein
MMVVHMIHLRDMGLVQGQNFDFESLSGTCAREGRATFLFTGHPEPLTAAASAPVHPVATL